MLSSAYFPFNKFRPHVAFLENRSPATKDPWARREAWRHDGFWSVARRTRALFPGFGLGLVAFGVYLGYDKWYWTAGPGKKEIDEWAQWTEERNARLAKEHHHH
ncbi:UNVERIFIED_CONTAM: hypothetical protein HDU68_005830 [Siphonaria sp. JEL0065]|nr:hypothetical protein HDU68_005830 [Siphonaria sp. JEL0065]